MQKLFFLVFFCLAPYSLFAQAKIEQTIITNEAVLGDELQFAITIETKNSAESDFSNVVFEGEPISFKGFVSQFGSERSINNRVVQNSNSVQYKYIFSFKPNSVGDYQLPAMPFKVDGKEYFTSPMTFKVIDTPVDDNILFNYQILDGKKDLFPSEEFTLRVIIALKEYRDMVNEPLVISNFSFFKSSQLEYILEPNPSMVIYVNDLPCKIKLMAAANTGSFQGFNKVYFFDMKFKVINSGLVTLANSIMKGSFQTNENTIKVDIFGRRRAVPLVKSLFAKSNAVAINCLSLPHKNVPDSFNGAIGNFTFDVVCSSDTGVKVGDPVTIIVSVKGKGNWEKVQAPPLHKYSQINDYFRVSENQPPGLLNEEETEKVFNVKLRVKSKLVTEIPPVEFSYFNILNQKYETLKSEAIPIKVFENSKEVEVVDFSVKESDENSKTEDQELQGSEKKEFDYTPVKIEIKNIVNSDYTVNHAVRPYLYFISFVPFVLLFIAQVIKSLGNREISEEQQIKFKEKNAYSLFKEKVKAISVSSSSNPYRDLGTCSDEFFRNRFPDKFSIIDADAFEQLEKASLINKTQLKNILELFEEIEDKRYSSKKVDPSEFMELCNNLDVELKNV